MNYSFHRASAAIFALLTILNFSACGSNSAGPNDNPPVQDLDQDGDGFRASVDCQDLDETVFPESPEVLNDGIDQNCTGLDRYVVEVVYEIDFNDDGSPDWIIAQKFNEKGIVTERSEDMNADGVIDSKSESSYRSDGKIESDRWDGDGNGQWDSIDQYFYDEQGYQVRRETDSNNDGSPERVEWWENDARGNRVLVQVDEGGDGSVNSIGRFSYDADGNVVRREQDDNADGIVNEARSYEYGDGLLTLYKLDRDNDGTPDLVIEHEYNASGHETRSAEDNDADGILDFIITTERDSKGHALKITRTDGAGAPISIEVREFNAQGYLLKKSYDDNADSQVDDVDEYSYDSAVLVLEAKLEYGQAEFPWHLLESRHYRMGALEYAVRYKPTYSE